MKGKKMASDPQGKMADDKAPKDVYAGKGSSVVSAAEDKKETFKSGGKAKKHVDAAEDKAMMRADRKPRKSGGSVLSSAAKGTPAKGRSVGC